MTNSTLKESIKQLEIRQAFEKKMLQEQFQLTYESITPINLIKNTLRQVAGSSEIKGEVLNASIGLTAGYFSKMLFERISNNPFKKILGSAILFGITNVVVKNPEVIKSLGRTVFRMIQNKGEEAEKEEV